MTSTLDSAQDQAGVAAGITATGATATQTGTGVAVLDVHGEPKPSWRGRLHEAAFFTALGLWPGLVLAPPGGAGKVAAAIYATGLLCLFGVSALFHRVAWSPQANRRMQRLDHSMIFVFIACSYTPIVGFTLETPWRERFLVLAWLMCLLGVSIRMLWIEAPRALTAGLYVVVSWLIVVASPALWAGLGPVGYALLFGGGVVYTTGACVYARRRPDPWPGVFGFHEIFHCFVILAAIMHICVVAFFALPRA